MALLGGWNRCPLPPLLGVNAAVNVLVRLPFQIFDCSRLKFSEIPQRLTNLLLPPDPIVINHIIRSAPLLGEGRSALNVDTPPPKESITQGTPSVCPPCDVAPHPLSPGELSKRGGEAVVGTEEAA